MATSATPDQLGDIISVPVPPKRIVSLVPSQTELLHALGLADEVVGITKFCIHPKAWFETKRKVGGTKNFDFQAIYDLEPDLIIGNKEENYLDGIQRLKEKYPVWMSDIYNLNDALSMITALGVITNRTDDADRIIGQVTRGFGFLRPHRELRALYLIWRKPWMAAGINTFIDDMLGRIGLTNVVNTPRYPEITEEEMVAMKPDVVFLSSEPFPFKQTHISELKEIVPSSSIVLVDGEMFSWYGSRLLHAPAYFNQLSI